MTQQIFFGKFRIPLEQVFLITKNIFAMVNHKPLVPGHVLVIPKRVTPKLQDLTEIQNMELFITSQEVAKMLESLYKQQSCLAIQNGKNAGQTVPHVHMHIMPRVLNKIQEQDQKQHKQVRSLKDMTEQANRYRSYFDEIKLIYK